MLVSFWYTLVMMNVSLERYVHTKVDNMFVLNNMLIPKITIKNKSNYFCHFYCEYFVAGIVRVSCEYKESNISDVLTDINTGYKCFVIILRMICTGLPRGRGGSQKFDEI